jgi:putative transposase
MREWQCLANVKWLCKYHVVIVRKYLKKVLFGRIRGEVGKIIRQLCRQKAVELIERHACHDHIHLVLSVPIGALLKPPAM